MADQYVQLALTKIGADTPTAQTILRVGVDIAQAVNKSKEMKGAEKMSLVQQTLRNALDAPSVKEKLTVDTRAGLNMVIDDVIPSSITLVIEAGRGHYDFKKPSVPCAIGFLTMLFRSCRATAVAIPVQVAVVPSESVVDPVVVPVVVQPIAPVLSEPVVDPVVVQPIVPVPESSAEPEKK